MNKKVPMKRFLAAFTDYFIIGLVLVLISKINLGPLGAKLLPVLQVVILITFYATKDLVFGNASIGKKIFGLIVLDEIWEKPSVKTILKRGIMTPISCCVYPWCRFVADIDFIDWELDYTNSRVVFKKRFENLREKALKENPKDYNRNLTNWYYEK